MLQIMPIVLIGLLFLAGCEPSSSTVDARYVGSYRSNVEYTTLYELHVVRIADELPLALIPPDNIKPQDHVVNTLPKGSRIQFLYGTLLLEPNSQQVILRGRVLGQKSFMVMLNTISIKRVRDGAKPRYFDGPDPKYLTKVD